MPSPAATAAFYRAIRNFAIKTKAWETAIRYQTLPDERLKLPLIALRVYGDSNQYPVIYAAAGLDTLEQALPEQLLVLPTASQLQQIKNDTGYLTDTEAAIIASLD